jgi:hypothetical protein
MKIYYLNQINTIAYSDKAIDFINTRDVVENIERYADLLNVSATAVAGIMAEESDSYWKTQFSNEVSDDYALSDLDAVSALAVFVGTGFNGLLTAIEDRPPRTHNDWVEFKLALPEDYEITGFSKADKILNPMLMDLGKANFKLITAIDLIDKYPGAANILGLSHYRTAYDELASDLVNGENGAEVRGQVFPCHINSKKTRLRECKLFCNTVLQYNSFKN